MVGPFRYNMALGFVLCGAGLLGAASGRRLLPVACGAMAALLGVLTLDVDLRIDELLMKADVTVGASHLERMAPRAALSLALSGISLLLMGIRRFQQRALLAGFLGAVTASLGPVALLGYLVGIEAAYRWGDFTPIAIHAAAGLAVLGAGVAAWAWRENRVEAASAPQWLPVLVAACGLTTTILLWQALDAQQHRHATRAVERAAAAVQTEITARMDGRLLALARMARRWELAGPSRRQEWEYDAALYLQHYPGYQLLGWADSSYRLRWLMPREGNEAAQDADLRADERQRAALEAARLQRQTVLTPTVTLPQGDKGFQAYVPLFPAGEFAGFIVGVFRVQPLLDAILHESISLGYAIAVFDGDQEIYHRYPAEVRRPSWIPDVPIHLHGAIWKLRITPRADLLAETSSRLPQVVLVKGSLISCLLAWAVMLAQAARRAEEEIRSLNAGLERRVAERTAQLEEAVKQLEGFSYSVSHDLRAPLRAMSGFSQALLEDYDSRLDGEARDYLHSIARGARTMGQLIDDLLAFSRLGRKSIAASEVDMAALARAAFEELQVSCGDRAVECRILPLLPAWADRAMVRQVFANLLSNAIKFTRGKQGAWIEVGRAGNKDGQNVYYVRDNGVGFDMQYVDKLFGVFQRLHTTEEFEGTGVGLAVVQRIVQRHGGRVWAQGRVNEGATFYFTLPAGGKQP